MELQRIDGRSSGQLRPIKFQYDAFGYSDASILFEIGNTKVFVSVTLQKKVPLFLRGSGNGWLTAEYAMIPSSTQKRMVRDSNQNHKNARSVEISRLIGRSLRTIVDLDNFGEKTIIVDCDVFQADGGTRVASITAACMALSLAEKRWLATGVIKKKFLVDSLAAISAGVVNNKCCLDLSFDEDNKADSDFNFILTKSGKIIEIQGTSEKKPLDWSEFEKLKKLVIDGVRFIFDLIQDEEPVRKPFFSLANRVLEK